MRTVAGSGSREVFVGGAELKAEELRRQTVLLQLMRVATSSLDMGEAFEQVSKLVGELIPHDRMSISLRPDGEDYLENYVLDAAVENSQRVLDRGHRLPLADSTPGEAVLSGRSLIRRFPEEACNPSDHALTQAGYRSAMVVLLRAEGRVIGTLNFASLQPGTYTELEFGIAQEVADHLASPAEHAYLGTRLVRQAEELRLLNEVSTAVYEAASISELFDRAHERLRALTGMEAGAVFLLNEERQVLELVYEHNVPQAAVDALREHALPVGQFIPGMVAKECRLMLVGDADGDERELPALRDAGVKTHVCIPLATRDRALGVIGLIDRRPHTFSQGELALFTTVGEQLGLALERARLVERQGQLLERQRFLNELMKIAVSSLDLRTSLT
jgi:GAF domain-containing protein